jgi:myo-inositol-1(or 4)-monophosphatase
MELEKLCNSTISIVKNVGAYIRQEREQFTAEDIVSKGLHNFVTHVDKESEQKLINELGSLLPDSGFIGEEGVADKKAPVYNWIIDPLDGTTNFIHGAPPYAISVALQKNNEIILGVVYEICMDECFYAYKGSSAYCNEKKIAVSNTKKVLHSLVATGFPYTNFSRLQPFLNSMVHLMRASHGIRRLGSAATDIAYVAAGRYEAFYEYGLHPWDVAAGALILKQAGGQVSDFSGGDNFLYGKEIIATNLNIYNEFLHDIHEIMVKENFTL